MKFVFIAILGAILFLACSNNQAGAPNTSETQNAICVSVVNSNGSPATYARIRVIGVQDWYSDIRDGKLDSSIILQTNEQGQAFIEKDSTQDMAVWVENNDEGLFRFINAESSDSLWMLGSKNQHRTLLQNVNGIHLEGTVFRLLGTTLEGMVDSLGILQFDSIPPGEFIPIEAVTWQTLGSVILQVQPNYDENRVDSILILADVLKLEDFNDGDEYGLLSSWTKGSHWWIFKVDEQVQIRPSKNSEIPSAILPVDSGAYEGSSLRIILSHGDSVSESVAMIGLTMGTGMLDSLSQFAWADLRGIKAMHFRAKGNTNLQILFKTKAVVELGDEKHFHASIALTDEWKQYSIPIENIVPFQNSLAETIPGGFSYASGRVQSIIFQTFDSGEFWLDDISIEGLPALQFHALNE